MRLAEKWKPSVKEVALVGMMTAVIEVCKAALAFLPNIELTTFWVILFTLSFGRKILFVIPAFILIEGVLYGFGIWWVMYLYLWPLLALAVRLMRKRESVWFWSLLSGFFGLFFGLFCALPYVAVGAAQGGIRSGLYAGLTWWVAGIPFDLVHCIGNVTAMSVLYRPVRAVMKKV
jgi:energy-coupling factor transport system substrate-specific component